MLTKQPYQVEVVEMSPMSIWGNNYIRDHGKLWLVKNVSDKVSFSDRKGPWLLIESHDHFTIWVHRTNDYDLRIKRATRMEDNRNA